MRIIFHILQFSQPKKNARTTRITVVGGSLFAEELIGHLRVLVRQNFTWEVHSPGENIFRVLFPSRTKMLRSTYWVSAKLQNGVSLKFEEFLEEYFGHPMPTVWMRVLNLPKILRKFRILWAVGLCLELLNK